MRDWDDGRPEDDYDDSPLTQRELIAVQRQRCTELRAKLAEMDTSVLATDLHLQSLERELRLRPLPPPPTPLQAPTSSVSRVSPLSGRDDEAQPKRETIGALDAAMGGAALKAAREVLGAQDAALRGAVAEVRRIQDNARVSMQRAAVSDAFDAVIRNRGAIEEAHHILSRLR